MSRKEEYVDLSKFALSKDDQEYIRGHKWTELGDILASHKALEEKNVVLSSSNSEESWKEGHKNADCPKHAEDYKFCRDGLKDFPYSEDFEAKARKWFHSVGLNLDQAKKLHVFYVDYIASKYRDTCKEEEESIEQAKQKLRARWGEDYQKNVELGRSAMQYLGGKNLSAILEAHGLGNHPEVLETFVKLGQMLQEDRVIPGVDIMNMTPDQALEERRKLQGDPNFFNVYLDSSNPDHESALIKMQAINKVIANY